MQNKKMDIIMSMIDRSLLDMETNLYAQQKIITLIVAIVYMFVLGLYATYRLGYTYQYFKYDHVLFLVFVYTCAMIFNVVSLLKSRIKLKKLKDKIHNGKYKI